MNKSSKLYTLLLFVFTLSLISCSDDGESSCNTTAFQVESSQLIAKVGLATAAYSEDGSSANCTALKDISQDLVDLLNGNLDCVGNADKQKAEDSIKDLEDSIAAFPC